MWRDWTRYEGSQKRNNSIVYAQHPCVRNNPHIVLRLSSRSRVPLGRGAGSSCESVFSKMYRRSCSGNHGHSAGARKNFSHRITQIKPTDPVIMNETRHPSFTSNQATRGAENAGPALKMAVASPRSAGGNHCLTTLAEVGNEAASPAPNANRVASMPPKLVAIPVNIPAMDQSVTDNPLTHRVPMRSDIQPQSKRNRQ